MNTFIRFVILIGALASTGYAEYTLAAHLGWHWAVAATLPVVLDLYLVHAVRQGQDVAPAVLAVVAASATSYTIAHPIDQDTPVRIAVSCIAPVILWRMEATARRSRETEPTPPETLAPVAETPSATHEAPSQIIPVSLIDDDMVTEMRDTLSPVWDTIIGTPADTSERLSDTDARRMAEEAFAAGVSARAAAESVTRSVATVYRWFREFKAEGIKQLA
ncbi:hypothetical protein LHJ74_30885 [Streptomyces sp. N2-109]|uniref:Uncharacterized protein n=1 Tax=Streptomyces gossypii TaxID=2883101 RepID=A0ABT2K282_9ACTN|nr:helix-turn-helix domain-containing protein [Streptomyces gossypii]MCT2594263.1 hypothetical protein [Streptomyces gossypii]